MFRTKFNTLWDFWENLHPFLRFCVFCVVLVIAFFFGVKPGYHLFKKWRLSQNLVAAKVASTEHRMDDARDLSLTVLRAGDPSIDAYRILEKSMGSLRDPRHGDIARALMFHPQGTAADRLNGFAAILKEGPLGLVGQAWAGLSADYRTKVEFATLFADRLIIEKKYSEAVSVLLDAKKHTNSELLDQRLAAILIYSEKKQGFDEAQRMVVAGMLAPNADLNRWFEVLELIPPLGLDASVLAPIRDVLMKSNSVEPARSSLMLLRLDYASNTGQIADIIESAIVQWKDKNPVELIKFLTDYKFNQRIIELFPITAVDKFPDLFRPLLNAFEQSGEWNKANLLLDANGSKMPKFEELAHRTLIAQQSGDTGAAVLAWNGAMGDAKARRLSDAYLTLSRIAEVGGMKERSEEAMIEAIRTGMGPLPLYTDLKVLLNSLRSQGLERVLLEICANYLSFEPGHPILLTQYAYLACLNDLTDPQIALTAIEPLAKAYPKELPIQCVLASIYLQANQPKKAADALDPLKIESEKLSPEFRAVYLATQVLNHRMKKDDPQIVNFPVQFLLLSEKKKFIALIEQAQN